MHFVLEPKKFEKILWNSFAVAFLIFNFFMILTSIISPLFGLDIYSMIIYSSINNAVGIFSLFSQISVLFFVIYLLIYRPKGIMEILSIWIIIYYVVKFIDFWGSIIVSVTSIAFNIEYIDLVINSSVVIFFIFLWVWKRNDRLYRLIGSSGVIISGIYLIYKIILLQPYLWR